MKWLSLFGTAALAVVAQASNSSCTPVYKNPNATLDDRVSDLLKRMSTEEKMSQLIQGDIRNYLNITDGRFNESGLEWSMTKRGHAVWTGLYMTPEMVKKGAKIAQDYQINQTELGKQSLAQASEFDWADFLQASQPTSRARVSTASSR